MPYKDASKQREYQRVWMNKKNRSLGIPERRKGEDPEKRRKSSRRSRYGAHAEAADLLLELERSLGTNQYSYGSKGKEAYRAFGPVKNVRNKKL